jgi:N-acetylglucosaminyldiphosphoundecaprenol N-acetyl-beta-D-mannosaminyltransferase
LTPKRVDILGTALDCVTREECLDRLDGFVSEDRCRGVFALNPEKVIAAQRDLELREALDGAGLLIPDGIGVVIAARLLYGVAIQRVPGIELMESICRRAAERRYRVFLFGAKEDINAEAARVLAERHPGLEIVGRANGYVPDTEMPQLIDRINGAGADILFVALGSPRQEIWIDRHASELRVKVCQGVGGSFDVIAGNVKRAPELFRDLNLEWFHRLVSQPQRVLRQTALLNFAWQLAKEKGRRPFLG